MLTIKSPLLYSFLFIVFIILTVKELTKVKKMTAYAKWSSCFQNGIDSWNNLTTTAEFLNHAGNISSNCKIILDLNIVKLSDSKFYISPQVQKSLTHATVGISSNFEAESQLKKRLPIINIFGATPKLSERERELFQKIGNYYPVAIGTKSGLVNVTMKPQYNYSLNDSAVPSSKSEFQLDLIYFLKDVLKQDFYYSIWFNIFFDELPNMLHRNRNFDENRITLCQININIDNDQKTNMKQFFKSLISDKRYVIIFEVVNDYGVLFLINFDNTTCRKKLGIVRNV